MRRIVSDFGPSDFEIVSDFGLRISDFKKCAHRAQILPVCSSVMTNRMTAWRNRMKRKRPRLLLRHEAGTWDD